MTNEEIYRKSLTEMSARMTDEAEIITDLGFNQWGLLRLALQVEKNIEISGGRRLTDKEILSWKTVADVKATIEDALKAVREGKYHRQRNKKKGTER